jgi:hypothetical protein
MAQTDTTLRDTTQRRIKDSSKIKKGIVKPKPVVDSSTGIRSDSSLSNDTSKVVVVDSTKAKLLKIKI